MGCFKIRYESRKAGLEKSTVFFGEALTKKSASRKNCYNYYPFGLTFNAYQRAGSLENRWKFQGQEHIDDLGLNWDSFKWRNHQPDIGRFFNVDPLAEDYYYNSPYAFSENKVIAHVELEGLESVPYTDKSKTEKLIDSYKPQKSIVYGFSLGAGAGANKIDRYKQKGGNPTGQIGGDIVHTRLIVTNEEVKLQGEILSVGTGLDIGDKGLSAEGTALQTYLSFNYEDGLDGDIKLGQYKTVAGTDVLESESIEQTLEVNVDAGVIDIGIQGVSDFLNWFVEGTKNYINELIIPVRKQFNSEKEK